LKKISKYYPEIIDKLISGIALHQIIRDNNNRLIDFIFLDLNKAFEEITGLKKEKIIGKKASEVLPYINKRKLNWYQLYSEIDLNNSSKTFDYYSESTKKWFKVNIFSLEKGIFVTEFHDISALKNAERQIIEREKNFREFFNSPGLLRAICTIKNEDIIFLEINDALSKFFKLSTEEAKGKSFADLKIPTRIKNIWIENFTKSEKLKEPVSFEYLSSSNLYRLAVANFLGKDENGFSRYSLSIQDITQRKIAEEDLRLSKEKFSKAFMSSPYAICITKFEDGTLLDVNEEFIRITGFEYSELIGRTTIELKLWFNPDDRNDFIKRLSVDGRIVQKEYKFRTKNGNIIIGLTSAEILNVYNIKCILVSVLDITERKKSEISLRQSEERFRKIFEEAPIGMLLLNKNFNYIKVNKSFCKMLGYEENEILNSSFRNFVDIEFIAMDEQNYNKLINGELSVYSVVKKFIKKNKETLWGASVTSLIRATDDNDIHLLEMVEDVTDKKMIEQNLILAKERAEEMSRIKSNFLAQMSHELRTPMVSIIGFSDLLKENLKEKYLIDFVDRINKGSKRLLNTLNQLLDLSVIEAKKLKIKFTTFNIVKEIKDIISFFENSAKSKGLELKFETEFQSLLVHLDLSILTQILNNLINNSIKYTESGYIKVTLKLDEKEKKKFICITIEDTGIGIPKDKEEIIWDSFRQVSEGHTRTFEGVGLGLTITRNLVDALGGKIFLKESTVGKGSTFVVLLPYFEKRTGYDLSHLKENHIDEQGLINNFPLPDILYVEDDREAVIIVNSFLKNICNVDVASNAIDGINQAKIKKYDIILMDINFRSGMDGIQAVEEIRKISGYENVPIAAVTAFASEKDREEFLQRGCSHFISKPFNREEFVTFIKEILESIQNKSLTINNNSSHFRRN